MFISPASQNDTRLKFIILAGLLTGIFTTGCHKHEAAHEEAKSKLIVTRPLKRDTTVTREYVCQIRSIQNIEVRAMERGYLEATHVKEGQHIKEGEPMFKILPLVYQADLKRAEAEAQVANVEYINTKRLTESKWCQIRNWRWRRPSWRRRRRK